MTNEDVKMTNENSKMANDEETRITNCEVINDCKVINASEIARPFVSELKNKIEKNALKPKLVTYLANNDQSAIAYARWTGKACNEIGIEFELRTIKRENLEEEILKANKDKSINAIMVYYPVFSGGHDQYLQNCVSTFKDCEGLSHLYRFNMYHNVR